MTVAITAYSTAKGYVQSAYLLMTNIDRFQLPNDTTFYLSFHMLAGFATELYLKSFLIENGCEEKTLRSFEIRHNLKKLLELAESGGLNNLEAKFLVDLLGDHHQSYEFRYMKPDSIYIIEDMQKIFEWFSSLDVAVDQSVGASASRGRKPGRGWIFPADRSAWRLNN